MKKLNKKGFTIVELVIVIAVIAILAGVLIPTFSTVVGKANQSAALQTARNTLQNALNMSSTASLSAKKEGATGGYTTMIVTDGYAFGYTGNQVESIDYPKSVSTVFTFAKDSATATDNNNLSKNTYNAILIAAENLTYGENQSAANGNPENGTKCEIKNVNLVISKWANDNKLGCTDLESVEVVYIDGQYLIAPYKKTADTELSEGKTYYTLTNGIYNAVESPVAEKIANYYEKTTNSVEIYVNSDFSNKVVVFTTFG